MHPPLKSPRPLTPPTTLSPTVLDTKFKEPKEETHGHQHRKMD